MSIILAILFFGFLVFVHELGHFVVARLCGVKVLEFAIGMGPKLISIRSKKSGIVYSIRLIPMGGFVNMLGENGMEAVQGSSEAADQPTDDLSYFATPASGESREEGSAEPAPMDPELAKQAYCNQSVWKRILISVAGPVMNLVLGFVLMIVLVLLTKDSLGTTVVADFPEQGSTSHVQLQVGDQIVKVGDSSVHTLYELAYEISEQGYRPVDVVVLREGERVTLKEVAFPVAVDGGIAFGKMDFQVLGDADVNFGTIVKHSFWRSVTCVKMVYDSLEGFFTKRYGVESVSGPIGITSVITEAAKTSHINLLHLLILISINLGIMNLLPIPALDGGHLLLYVIEVIRGKRLKPEVEGIINFVGLVLIFGLAILIAIKDVIAL